MPFVRDIDLLRSSQAEMLDRDTDQTPIEVKLIAAYRVVLHRTQFYCLL